MSHKPKRAAAVIYFATGGPPSSPPMALLRRIRRIMIAIAASEQKIVTENAKLKGNLKGNWSWLGQINENFFANKNLLTFQMERGIPFRSRRDRLLPLSTLCQYPKRRWQHYCRSHFRHSHPHICPEWQPLY